MKYTIAKVSNQITAHHIEWSIPIEEADTLFEANQIADIEYRKLVSEFEQRPDYGNGAIMGETIIVHDGKECF